MDTSTRAPPESVAKWAGYYAKGFSPWDSRRPASQLVSFLQDHPDGRHLLAASSDRTSPSADGVGGGGAGAQDRARPAEALEIGCGTGAACVWMAQHGMRVVGVDLIPDPIATATSAAADAGVSDRCKFVVADLMALPDHFSFASTDERTRTEDEDQKKDGGFDLVYDCQCFHVLRKEIGEQPVVEKIARLVKPGGLFFTLVGNCNEEMRGPERLTKEELSRAFAAAFDVIAIYETRFDMTEHYKTLPQPPLAWCGIFKKR